MKMRAYNFGAGPAMLPEPVLLEAQRELLNWQGSGMSVMEIGHRTEPFIRLMDELERDLRALISIPDNYHVLFLNGASRAQFSMVPMNLLNDTQEAGYLISGIWSDMAFEEACKIKHAYCLGSTKSQGFLTTPELLTEHVRENTGYVYYVPNETVNGVRYPTMPKISHLPLVADMTSCFLSEPINVSDFGLIFAGAQKNVSIAGLTIVIIRQDLLEQASAKGEVLPTLMDYRTHVTHHSLYATPPTFNCYLAGLMLKWIKTQGGVQALYHINCQKAALLYQYIDTSDFYHCAVQDKSRSIVNVCFSIVNKALEDVFVAEATRHGLYALQGHRTVGGLRASLYNAMPLAGVQALITYMQTFCEKHR